MLDNNKPEKKPRHRTAVSVNPRVLSWALKRSGLTTDYLQNKFGRINEWLSGERYPTLLQLESFAKATSTPFGYFFLDEPPEVRLPIPLYRTRVEAILEEPSPNLIETVYIMQRRQDWMRDYLIDRGNDELPFVQSARTGEQPEYIAHRIRNTLGLVEGWAKRRPTWTDALETLRQAIEKAGILIVTNGVVQNNTHRKLEPEEFRGFVLVDNYVPLIFINGADGIAAQMFTAAHELAHVFFGSSAAFDLREMQPAADPMEQACNKVAAEFLVPARELSKFWPNVSENRDRFNLIARQFKVSPIVGARRALDLKLIDKQGFLIFYNDYQQKEYEKAKKRKGGGDFHANQNSRIGRPFANAIIRATKEGTLLYAEAYRLTGLYGKTFSNYASSLGFGGV